VVFVASNDFKVFMSATYDNGDRSDNWCGSHTQVPQELLGPAFYDAPTCGYRNIFVIGKSFFKLDWDESIDYVVCE
jgi:hypothetical protein